VRDVSASAPGGIIPPGLAEGIQVKPALSRARCRAEPWRGSFNGVWAQRGSLVVFAVHGGSEPSYAGSLSGTALEGVAVQRNGKRGFWTAALQP
jgi:hypothetical protein